MTGTQLNRVQNLNEPWKDRIKINLQKGIRTEKYNAKFYSAMLLTSTVKQLRIIHEDAI